jgi:Fur family ferric uptake transcriptional regulator
MAGGATGACFGSGTGAKRVTIGGTGRDTDRVAAIPAPDRVTVERVGELLRAHGLRRMASRIAVLTVLEPVDGHLPVAEIHRHLVESAPAGARPPDLATVYRTVTTLVDCGVLHALPLDDGVTTYGLAVDPHHHAVCTRCGTIIEVPAPRLTVALEHARAGSSFTLSEQAGLTLRGLCPRCQ